MNLTVLVAYYVKTSSSFFRTCSSKSPFLQTTSMCIYYVCSGASSSTTDYLTFYSPFICFSFPSSLMFIFMNFCFSSTSFFTVIFSLFFDSTQYLHHSSSLVHQCLFIILIGGLSRCAFRKINLLYLFCRFGLFFCQNSLQSHQL